MNPYDERFMEVVVMALSIACIGLPLALVAHIWLQVADQARAVFRLLAIDVLEVLARWDAQQSDRIQRDVKLVEAGYYLKMRRLELREKRLELLDSLDSEKVGVTR